MYLFTITQPRSSLWCYTVCMYGLPVGRILITTVIASVVGISSLLLAPEEAPTGANIKIESDHGAYSVGDSFTVTITAETFEPVNVFKGLVTFDPDVLQVTAIDYNVSLIDLWAELPWFSNGAGTLNFTGGTTRPGGFSGKDTLLSITFTAKSAGNTALALEEVRVLRHDGLGSDALVNKPIDSLFSITEKPSIDRSTVTTTSDGVTLKVLTPGLSTDLNEDGKQSIADVSIFMKHLATNNLRSDFDGDGTVGLKDLSILME